jgi:hypothetical protein
MHEVIDAVRKAATANQPLGRVEDRESDEKYRDPEKPPPVPFATPWKCSMR